MIDLFDAARRVFATRLECLRKRLIDTDLGKPSVRSRRHSELDTEVLTTCFEQLELRDLAHLMLEEKENVSSDKTRSQQRC